MDSNKVFKKLKFYKKIIYKWIIFTYLIIK